jgi:translation initiation factor IF-2
MAGCLVTSGVLDVLGRIHVIRDGTQLYEGVMGSLKHIKEDVLEVREGLECAVTIPAFLGLKAGDVLECYRSEAVARTPASAAADA